jgi:hypothetical protein
LLCLWALILSATPAPPASYDAAWARSLPPGVVVRVPVGTYAGPWHLGPGVHLIADSGAVLEARQSGAPALVIEGAGVTVEGLAVRVAAGAIGIEASGSVGLTLRDVRVTGGARGLAARGGDVSWSGGSVEGTTDYGVWATESHLSLRSVRLRDNRGAAVYLADTQAELFRCGLSTSEYGVLGTRSQVDITESDFVKLWRAGIGLTRSSGRLLQNHFSGPFVESAVSILAAPSFRMERNRIEQTGSVGIKFLSSTASLEANTVSGARADKSGLEGNGLYLYTSHVRSRGDVLLDNDGTSVTVIGGVASLVDCRIEHSGQTVAYVASRGVLVLSHCHGRGNSTDLVVEPDSTLTSDDSHFDGPPGASGLDAGGEPRSGTIP